MTKLAIRIVFLAALSAATAFPQAKNVILFVGDGGGVNSLNAAGIYGYGKPQALFIQSMPNVALADSSTTLEWVTDGAASASAYATGKKGRNGAVSISPEGEAYKTVMEYAQERGLSTGIIGNATDGITYAAISASYAHASNRASDLDIYHQFLSPKFGNGVDIALVASSKKLNASVPGGIDAIGAEVKAKGYTFARALEEVTSLDSSKTRVVGIFDNENFDMTAAVKQAVARLSQNPKGFFLVVYSDCHLGKTRASLVRLVDLDKAIRAVAEDLKSNTLMLYTADHGYALYIKGEKAAEAQKAADHKKITEAIHLEDQHTAEEVPVVAMGPGSERVKGFISNADVFGIMLSAFGWQ